MGYGRQIGKVQALSSILIVLITTSEADAPQQSIVPLLITIATSSKLAELQ